jgi:hypothetical protein
LAEAKGEGNFIVESGRKDLGFDLVIRCIAGGKKTVTIVFFVEELEVEPGSAEYLE